MLQFLVPKFQELGGNSWWFDRFLAQHIAIFYYVMTAFMYAVSPRMACEYEHLLFYPLLKQIEKIEA